MVVVCIIFAPWWVEVGDTWSKLICQSTCKLWHQLRMNCLLEHSVLHPECTHMLSLCVCVLSLALSGCIDRVYPLYDVLLAQYSDDQIGSKHQNCVLVEDSVGFVSCWPCINTAPKSCLLKVLLCVCWWTYYIVIYSSKQLMLHVWYWVLGPVYTKMFSIENAKFCFRVNETWTRKKSLHFWTKRLRVNVTLL